MEPRRTAGSRVVADVRNFIADQWCDAESARTQENRNPGDLAELVSRSPDSGPADVLAAVASAESSLAAWRSLGPIRRGEIVLRAARLLAERREEFAEAITREQGKLLREARGEVDRTVSLLEYTAGEGRRLGGTTLPADDPRTLALTRREPIGVVGLVTPWNFPLAIPAWKVAPALLSGCTAVLKPSPLTPLTASLLVECFVAAGAVGGVLNLVHGGREVGETLVKAPAVAGISFTGSVEVGRAIHTAGAPRFLRTQLEMGGKNAALVLADADLDLAADAIVAGAFGQAGQRCSATSRVVVDRAVHDELVHRLAERAAALQVGSGLDDGSQVGPVVSEGRLQACLDGTRHALAEGAVAVTGGERRTEGVPDGWFMSPTVLDRVRPESYIAQEEIFGPVLSVIECDGFDDGLRIVNSVRYGMAAAVFTADASLAFEALERVDAGMLHVNRPGVGAYPHMPHIGTKQSQYGPAECSPQVWDFYTEWRTACIRY
ncbi:MULTISPECIES: aldehyde dehydrogenase [unclassified Kitasatospora]|uniref:aldehyde dehydrogenase family protein n=1 Tax=unclassified Kitasatospora TaxID=2633591 RepID=UPI00070BF650|nr:MULTISPECIES: aldehyde dehydrogenase family protein [unclassified Kitasatospora]KQV19536.1 aldehyde dehydrogenase [Kitasatospora sp. Root107]KRB72903.1 aldehyde dehydrogenase [Kitasatospora sp. Root187]